MAAHRTRVPADHGRLVLVTAVVVVTFALVLVAALREYTTLRAATAHGALRDSVDILLRAAPWEGSDMRLEYRSGRHLPMADTQVTAVK